MTESNSQSFWKGKKVFVTSPTSFLGAWTCLSLEFLGAQVFGFGEASSEAPNLFDICNIAQKISMTYGDIHDETSLSHALNFVQADVVLHLGEMGFLFDESRKSPELFAKSVVGTASLLEFLRETASVRSVVVVSSDKVYARPALMPAKEDSAVAAYESLPTARLCSELVALSYRHSFFHPEKYNKHKIALATARLSAGFGPGDFSQKSFLFEAIDCFRKGGDLELRHPQSLRSWIDILDQVHGLLVLAETLWVRGPKLAPTYNLGTQSTATVGDVYHALKRRWFHTEQGSTRFSEPKSFHGMMDSSLALHDLGWQPTIGLEEMIASAISWYKSYYEGHALKETARQIEDYFKS